VVYIQDITPWLPESRLLLANLEDNDFVKRCKICQENGHLIHIPASELRIVISPWPFALLGMDIVGPFPPTSRKRRFLVVDIDYFTKWIEVELLTKITSQQARKLVWKFICRFGLPYVLVVNHKRPFTDRKLKQFYDNLGIKHLTSSVKHPQTNGQAEVTNKVIINELKKRVGKVR